MQRRSAGARFPTISGLLAVLLCTPALAQDVAPFDPAASNAGDSGTLSVESPFLPGSGALFGAYATIAEDTAVVRHANGTYTPLVSQIVGTTLHGGWTFGTAARVDLLIPLYPWVDAPVSDFSGAAAGDLRLQGTIPLVEVDRTFALALVPKLGLPTGSAKALTRRGFHGGLTVALGGETDIGLDWTANLGLVGAQPKALREVALGGTFDISGGLTYRVDDHLRLGGEFNYSAGFKWADRRGNGHAAGHLFARSVSDEGVGLTAGVGTGIV
ncbi:MAG: hypothetical protein KC912_26865, partial [Proteobacteria bacterium]|nr:hypothetical protein [Pseudomonadota bacterium]